jgi:hypothetical protein
MEGFMKITALLLTVFTAISARAAASAYPYDAGTWAAGDSAVYDVYDNGIRVGILNRDINEITAGTVTLHGLLTYDPIWFLPDVNVETVYDRSNSDLVSVTVDGKELDKIHQWNFGHGADSTVVVPAGEFKVKKYDAIDYVNGQSDMWMDAADTCLDGIVKMTKTIGFHTVTFKLRSFKCAAHP